MEETWCEFCGLQGDRFRLIGWTCTICDRNGERQVKYPRPSFKDIEQVQKYQAQLLGHALDFSDHTHSGEIIRNRLWIDDMTGAESEALQKRSITAVVSLNDPGIRVPSYPESPGISYHRIRIWDKDDARIVEHFEEAFLFISTQLSIPNGRVLVHCAAGVSRSAAICIGYLMRSHGLSFLGAYSVVKAARMVVCPNYGFLKQLVEYEKTKF